MVKIDGPRPFSPSKLSKKDGAKSKTKDTFSLSSSETSGEHVSAASVNSTKNVGSLSQLMSLQEVGDEQTRNQKAINDSETILNSLERLQNQILSGCISKTGLSQIIRLADTLPQSLDPKLLAIVAEIKQRAMIEVAKIEMSTGQSLL